MTSDSFVNTLTRFSMVMTKIVNDDIPEPYMAGDGIIVFNLQAIYGSLSDSTKRLIACKYRTSQQRKIIKVQILASQ